MLGSRLFWTLAIGSFLVVGAIAVPVSGLLWGHGPVLPGAHDRHGGPEGPGGTAGPSYSVTFSETGLPNGTSWYVRVSGGWGANATPFAPGPALAPDWHHGRTNGSNTSTIAFALPNGSYWFSVFHVTENGTLFVPSPSSGGIGVNGSNVSVAVAFAAVPLYSVVFTETGLPNGTFWSVGLTGAGQLSDPPSPEAAAGSPAWSEGIWNGTNGTSVGFALPDGNYSFSVPNVSAAGGLYVPTPAAGNVTVNGSTVTVDVAFAPVPYFTVTFAETGLPTGTSWSVALVGGPYVSPGDAPAASPGPFCGQSQFNSTTNTTANFTVPDGNYTFFVEVAGNGSVVYVPNPASGNVSVNGSDVVVDVTFSPVALYTLTFAETGLPSGANWSVGLFNQSYGGSWNASTTSTVNFTVPNGSYDFAIGNVSNGSSTYVPSPSCGNVTVNGSSVTVDVTFSAVLLSNVTFVESGLPNGTWWSVDLFNASAGPFWNGSTGTTVNFTVPNGTYNFSVGSGGNGTPVYVPTPAFGTVSVDGSSVTIDVTFSLLAVYPVTFVETGLPNGTVWFVHLVGATPGWYWNGSTGTTVNFTVPNGTYAFTVWSLGNGSVPYLPTPASGTVTVNGSAVTVTIAFAPEVLYTVTFVETGLPNGTDWYAAVALGEDCCAFNQSTNTSLSFALPNGTYAFSVGPVSSAGVFYVATPAYGNATVAGGNVTVDVSFAPAS